MQTQVVSSIRCKALCCKVGWERTLKFTSENIWPSRWWSGLMESSGILANSWEGQLSQVV